MSNLSAGKIQVDNLTVAGLGAGAIQATNLKFNNLDVSGSLTAPNLKSSTKIAKDGFHVPNPTGPFAVDIVPMKIKDMKYNFDIFGSLSRKYWGTVDNCLDDISLTMYIPSNRTGTDKDVSAQMMNCTDSSGNSLVDGNTLLCEDDAIWYLVRTITFWYIPELEPAFKTAADAFNTYYTTQIANINTSPSVRTQLQTLWNNIKATETAINYKKYYSVYTGKIWYNNLTDASGGYKKFVTVDPPVDNGILTGSGTKFYTTTYTANQLPSASQINSVVGRDNCPILFFFNGTASPGTWADIGSVINMASNGFVVIVMNTMLNDSDINKNTYNQSFIDHLKNGFLGDNTQYSFESAPFLNNTTGIQNNKKWSSNTNLNNPASIDPIMSISGQQRVGLPGVLTYTDLNGRTMSSTDVCSIYGAVAQQISRTDSSGNISYNNIINHEKLFYTIKQVIRSIDNSGLYNRIDFDNVGGIFSSIGGYHYNIMQRFTSNSGNSVRLRDASGASVPLMRIKAMFNLQGLIFGPQRENQGIEYRQKEYGTYHLQALNSSTNVNYTEAFAVLPTGFTVPSFHLMQPGAPEGFSGSYVPSYAEPLQWLLQATRNNNRHISEQSIVMYQPIMGHAASINNSFFSDKYGISTALTIPNHVSMKNKDGWDWPDKYAIDEYIYTNGDIQTVGSQLLVPDLYLMQVKFLWFRQFLCADILNQSSLETIMNYAQKGGSQAYLGPDELENSNYMDSFFRFIGPHKIETIRDDTANANHLSIDFGKNRVYEDSSNNLRLSHISTSLYNKPINVTIDGSVTMPTNSRITLGSTPIIDQSGSLFIGNHTVGTVNVTAYPQNTVRIDQTNRQVSLFTMTDSSLNTNFNPGFTFKSGTGGAPLSMTVGNTFSVSGTMSGFNTTTYSYVNDGISYGARLASGPTSVYLGRGFQLSVTNSGKLCVLDGDGMICKGTPDSSGNILQLYTPVIEPAFNDLVPDGSNVLNIVDPSFNTTGSWSRLSGTEQMIYVPPDDSGNVYGGYNVLGSDDVKVDLSGNTVPLQWQPGSADYADYYLNTWWGTNATYDDVQIQYQARIIYDGSGGYTNGGLIPHAWSSTIFPRNLLDSSGNTKTVYPPLTFGIQAENAYPSYSNDLEFHETGGWNRGAIIANGQYFNVNQMNALCGSSGEWVNFKVQCIGWSMKVWINDVLVSKYYEDVTNNNNIARKSGKIAIQQHFWTSGNQSGVAQYRNILVKPITRYFKINNVNTVYNIIAQNIHYNYAPFTVTDATVKWLCDSSNNPLFGQNLSDFTNDGSGGASWVGKVVIVQAIPFAYGGILPNQYTRIATNAKAVGCVGIINYQCSPAEYIGTYSGTTSKLTAATGNETLFNFISQGNVPVITEIPYIGMTYNNANPIINNIKANIPVTTSFFNYFSTTPIEYPTGISGIVPN
jgi:hypothetical protein